METGTSFDDAACNGETSRRLSQEMEHFQEDYSEASSIEMKKRKFQVQYQTMETMEISLDANDWKYKNEGGEHIIVAYVGETRNDVLKGKVLRIKKRTHKVFEGELESFLFIKNTMIPLLGERYIYPGVPVRMTAEFIQRLNELIAKDRPQHRLAHRLNVQLSYAILMPDLTLLPFDVEKSLASKGDVQPITVEIKPKWGALPTSPFIKQQNRCKYKTCRYCMHQYLKLRDKSIKTISQYCPLDFFSGDKQRMLNAIRRIMDSPQNNLKVYRDGNLIFSGALGGKSDDCDIESIKDSLQTYFATNHGQSDPIDTLVNILVQIFISEPLLPKLKQLQLLDTLDIEAIYYLFNKVNDSAADAGPSLSENPIDRDTEPLDAMSSEEMQTKISEYLTAATAKDCSVMVTLYPVKCDGAQYCGFPVVHIDEGSYLYRLALVDLDPKSAENIPPYHKLDQKIAEFYRQQDRIKECQA